MRSPQEIQTRLEREEAEHNRKILAWSLHWDLEKLANRLSQAYENAFYTALRHRPNGKLVEQFATLTWLAGSDLDVTEYPWLQFGMPRVRRLAYELKIPFPIENGGLTYLRAKRMSNGLSCVENCLRCFSGR